jgi:hypothetical protein
MAAAFSIKTLQCHNTVTKLMRTEEMGLLGYDTISICMFTNVLKEPAASIFRAAQELILMMRAANFFRAIRTSMRAANFYYHITQ